MKHNNFWKRTAAGLAALLIVAGAVPANVGGFLTGGTAIVAKADYEDGTLVVGGTSVTSTLTSGDGWSFDADTNTLTLNGANITQCGEGCGIYYGGNSQFNIVLVGDNKIDISSTEDAAGIVANSLINISGTGKLTVKS